MKKMIAGIAVLSVLLSLGLYNAFSFKEKMLQLEGYVLAASILIRDGDYSEGVRLVEKAIKKWEKSEGYTHIFLHHDGIDKVTDAFYDYLGILRSTCGDDEAVRDNLLYHIQSIYKLELPTFGAIF